MLSTPALSSVSRKIIQLQHKSNNVKISTIIRDNNIRSLPTTLFLHGLDSSSKTWENVFSRLEYPAVAVDLRGCGSSILGDPNDFTPDAIADDIFHFVRNHPMFQFQHSIDSSSTESNLTVQRKQLKPFVIVGHSMGARIAMTFAAKYPQCINALVIEDMDIQTRQKSTNPIQKSITESSRNETLCFERKIRRGKKTTEADVFHVFKKEGYPKSMVEKWLDDGRVAWKDDSDGGYYYSDVNPAFRLLCYEQFFESNHGEETWEKLAEISNKNNESVGNHDQKTSFPCHVMIAGKEATVCDESSICKMKDFFRNNPMFFLHRYPNSTHSIHNSDQERFLTDLKQIICTASFNAK